MVQERDENIVRIIRARSWNELRSGMKGWVVLDFILIKFVVTSIIERSRFDPKSENFTDVKYYRHVEVYDFETKEYRTLLPNNKWYAVMPVFLDVNEPAMMERYYKSVAQRDFQRESKKITRRK